ncbi:MAG: alpha/beta fold hydrolase [Nevskia sp.]|nr:alpha/beta fold hydrolase [Nevskia sp.]
MGASSDRSRSGEAGLFGRIGAFVDEAIAGATLTPSDREGTAIARGAIFLLDEAAKLVEGLRCRVTGEQSEAPPPGDSAVGDKGFVHTLELILALAMKQPELTARTYARFAAEALSILRGESAIKPAIRDFRFKDQLWLESGVLRTLLQLYLAWADTMGRWLEEQQLDAADRRRIAFIFEQLVAAVAPSNLPINPSALRRADRTEGASAVNGVHNWVDDVIRNHAMPRQISRDAYVVGKDLALTEGAVVFRNAQLELIQYAPLTETVRRRPVLIFPPQINKYYAFDLRPANSMIGHLVKSGLQVFTLSWFNPTAAQSAWNLDTYVAAAIEATDVMREITSSRRFGVVSACAGGLSAMAMLGYLAERGDSRIANHSLLVTCLLPNEGSDLELFATPTLIEMAGSYVRNNGVMYGDELAKVFYWLRPNDLVWRYWINNYLLGKAPPPLDVLFWDNDSTRVPAALHADFVDMYTNDVFRKANALSVLGRPIDFRRLKVDSYFVGGEDDNLMPWIGCYHACQLFRGRHAFVLSTSGHVQSLLRPPRIANTVYYTNEDIALSAAEWRRTAVEKRGSWWEHWHGWLHEKSGGTKKAPNRLGSDGHPPLMPAPGSYVFD